MATFDLIEVQLRGGTSPRLPAEFLQALLAVDYGFTALVEHYRGHEMPDIFFKEGQRNLPELGGLSSKELDKKTIRRRTRSNLKAPVFD